MWLKCGVCVHHPTLLDPDVRSSIFLAKFPKPNVHSEWVYWEKRPWYLTWRDLAYHRHLPVYAWMYHHDSMLQGLWSRKVQWVLVWVMWFVWQHLWYSESITTTIIAVCLIRNTVVLHLATHSPIKLRATSISRRTSGSAFSLIVKDAEVCWRNRLHMPILICFRSVDIARLISEVIKWHPRDGAVILISCWNQRGVEDIWLENVAERPDVEDTKMRKIRSGNIKVVAAIDDIVSTRFVSLAYWTLQCLPIVFRSSSSD